MRAVFKALGINRTLPLERRLDALCVAAPPTVHHAIRNPDHRGLWAHRFASSTTHPDLQKWLSIGDFPGLWALLPTERPFFGEEGGEPFAIQLRPGSRFLVQDPNDPNWETLRALSTEWETQQPTSAGKSSNPGPSFFAATNANGDTVADRVAFYFGGQWGPGGVSAAFLQAHGVVGIKGVESYVILNPSQIGDVVPPDQKAPPPAEPAVSYERTGPRGPQPAPADGHVIDSHGRGSILDNLLPPGRTG